MASINYDTEFERKPLVHIVTPQGMLGYGVNQDLLDQGLRDTVPTGVPTAIILDSGSTDGGPNCLALGVTTCPRTSYKRDLTKILRSAHQFKVPVLIGSAGGDGSDEHVEEVLRIVEEIAAEPGNEHYDFNTIALFAGIPKALVSQRLADGAISGCGRAVPPAKQADIDEAPRIVAQMGPEPFVNAMEEVPDFNIVLGGRAYDPAPFVAFAYYWLKKSIPEPNPELLSKLLGGFTHMAKIMECGGVCSVPKSAAATATVYIDGTFEIRPLDPKSRCTSLSVAAHTLYEKTRPDLLHGPGGYLDLSASSYEQLEDGRTVRVRGGIFHSWEAQGVPYAVKLEAARKVGFRTMYIGSIRDPTLISQIDEFLERVKAHVALQVEGQGVWKLDFHIYGRNGRVNGQKVDIEPDEIFIVGEALAETQSLATAVSDAARVATIHGPYPGQKATSGNFAFGLVGSRNVEMGPCTEFCLYHLMELQPGEETSTQLTVEGSADVQVLSNGSMQATPLFRWRKQQIGKGTARIENGISQVPVLIPAKSQLEKNIADNTATSEADKLRSLVDLPAQPTLVDIAGVLRSKNSGPYEITFDVMFETNEGYQIIKEANILNSELIQGLYDLKPEEILWCGWFDQARAWKATIPRKRHGVSRPGGGFMENDIHGSQRYIPLLRVPIPEEVLMRLRQACGIA